MARTSSGVAPERSAISLSVKPGRQSMRLTAAPTSLLNCIVSKSLAKIPQRLRGWRLRIVQR